MGRPLKLQGELLEKAKSMLADGKKRGAICKELKISYKQLAEGVGNAWKHSGTTPEAAGATQEPAEVA